MGKAAAVAAGMLCAGVAATAAAAIPVLPEPAALAGAWLLSDGSGRAACPVRLEAAPAPGGWRLESEQACLEALVPHVASWRPEPDGVVFTASDRRALAFFAKTARGYAWVRPDGARLELVRAPG